MLTVNGKTLTLLYSWSRDQRWGIVYIPTLKITAQIAVYNTGLHVVMNSASRMVMLTLINDLSRKYPTLGIRIHSKPADVCWMCQDKFNAS